LAAHSPFFYRESNGIRITVRPWYLASQSRPQAGHYVFAYHIRIENVGEVAAQLLERYWRIHDAIGEDTEVQGEGVVGEQPHLPPFHAHEYQSYCVLKSPAGHMQGHYTFVRPDGSSFQSAIPRFILDAPTIAEP
jgi:ApaG protein